MKVGPLFLEIEEFEQKSSRIVFLFELKALGVILRGKVLEFAVFLDLFLA